MYYLKSNTPGVSYVFDEFRFPDTISQSHPIIEHRGKIIGTIEVSMYKDMKVLEPSLTDIIRDIDEDCNAIIRLILNNYTSCKVPLWRKDYHGAAVYISSMLCAEQIDAYDRKILIHKIRNSGE